MSVTDQFLMAMKAYQELQVERQTGEAALAVTPKTLDPRAAGPEAGSPPPGSLILGLAEDGLPLLLNVFDPSSGPILIAGDRGIGKTVFLKWLAHSSSMPEPGDIQFGVVTPFPEEWSQSDSPNGLGIWPAYHPSAHEFLSKLIYWAETLPKTRQAILLLVDGLDLLTMNGFHLQQELRWLLTNGPERHIWPVVTTNPAHLSHMVSWLRFFHTRILGRIKQIHNARLLADDPQMDLAGLIAGTEFILSQPGAWLKFLLPPLPEGV
jgi:hypothetical protein